MRSHGGSIGVLRGLLVVAAACLFALGSGGPAAADTTATVAGTQPDWATPGNDEGDQPGATRMAFSVWLGWRDQDTLAQLLADQQNPASRSYRHWLSPSEFRARFAPDQSEVDAIDRWLQSQGFDVLSVPRNRLFVTAGGTVSQVERAFGVNEGIYRLDGKLVAAPSNDPHIPRALADSVTAITGLDGAMSLARPRSDPPGPPPIGKSVGPCSRWWGEKQSSAYTNPVDPGRPLPWIVCGYTPSQIASAYHVDTLHRLRLTGKHQRIAIVGAFRSPTIRQDVDTFSRHYHLTTLGHHYSEVVAPGTERYPRDAAETQSWYIEQALDVEWSHAMAPDADITYVAAANDARGLDQALNHAVDNRLGDVVSNSWGMPERWVSSGEVRALNAVFQQAAAQGLSVVVASGDDGDNDAAWGHISVGFPDSSPLVTSVGGTSLAIDRWGRRMWETGWGTGELVLKNADWVGSMPFGDFIYGGGGGVSHLYDQPAYQASVVPAGLSTWKGQARRAEPDIALDADPQTGVIFTQSWAKPNGGVRQVDSWIGGTSLGAPLLAGMTALANQAWHGSRGPLNPALYRYAGTGVFHDIVPSDGRLAVLRNGLNANGKVITRLRSLDHDSSLATARGWDNVTGLGSPDAFRLLFALR
jgi:subtilase family serine protease